MSAAVASLWLLAVPTIESPDHQLPLLLLPVVIAGPVTVPILLSLGVGVMKAQRQKQMALAVLEDAAVKQSEGQSHQAACTSYHAYAYAECELH